MTLGSFSQTWLDSLNFARKLYKSGDYTNALKYYDSIDKSKPANVYLDNEIGQTAYKLGNNELAKEKFEAGLNNKSNKIDKAKSYHNLGNTMMGLKDYQGAVNSYKEALRNNPNDSETRYNLSEAIRKLQKNNPNNPNNPNNQDNQSDNNQKNDDKKNNNKDKSKDQNNQSKNQKNQQNPAEKPNNSVERLLDQLNKKDAANNRKFEKKRDGMMSNTKDW
jgi:tetratricopeptide (TPR) repeat protein